MKRSLLKPGLALLAFAAVVFAGGCAFSTAPVADPVYEDQSIQLGEQLLACFARNDAEGFLKLLPETVQKQFTAESFKSTRAAVTEAFGEIDEYGYMTKLEAPLFIPYLYRVRFKRDSVNPDADGVRQTIEQETLFRIVVAPMDGKPRIISFGFL